VTLYFLDYDLRKQRNYQALYDELARFGAVRMLESSWCFHVSNSTAAKVRDHFKLFIDTDDGLWVAAVTEWATVGVRQTPKNLTTA